MRVYQVSREFAPLAGAGGLKEVVSGIAGSLRGLGIDSSVFIPCYGFIDSSSLESFVEFRLKLGRRRLYVKVFKKRVNGVLVYLIDFPAVKEKNSIYTYTKEDELKNSHFLKGSGFADSEDINIIFQLSFIYLVYKYLPVPDVVNLHDAHTGLIPAIIKKRRVYRKFFLRTRLFFTIHNAGYVYHQSLSVKKLKEYGCFYRWIMRRAVSIGVVDSLFLAALYSKVITVSSFYASEILSLEHEDISGGFGKFCKKNHIAILGITNGADVFRFKSIGIVDLPDFKSKRDACSRVLELIEISGLKVYGDVKITDNRPVYLFQNRVTEQKGIDDFIEGFKNYISLGGKGLFVIMGQGEKRYEKKLQELSDSYTDSFVYIDGYAEELALNLFLLSDFFVLTSLWEPCGLTDFEAQLVGSIPVVRNTGGLKKVVDGRTGFLFNSVEELTNLLLNCDTLFLEDKSKIENLKKNAYSNIFSNYTWDSVVERGYLPLFKVGE